MPHHCVVRISPPGPGGPGVKDGDVSESTDVNAPGGALVMSIGYWEISTETLDELCMSMVEPVFVSFPWWMVCCQPGQLVLARGGSIAG